MTLKEWLQNEGRTATWLANKMGMTVHRVSGISTGRIMPSLPEAITIGNHTDLKVEPHDLLAAVAAWRAKHDK